MTDVNYAFALRRSVDRFGLEEALEPMRERGFKDTILDGPAGRLDLPIWTSVIFSLPHGSYPDLVRRVDAALRETGLDRYLEPG